MYIEIANPGVMSRSIIHYFYHYSENMSMLHMVICAILIATLFPDDWNYGISKYAAVRSSKHQYALSKVTSAWFSCFVFKFLSISLFTLIFYLIAQRFGVEPEYDVIMYLYAESGSIGSLIEKSVLLYFGLRMLLNALSVSFWAMLAFYVSVLNANIFLTVATPLLAYELIIELERAFGVGVNFGLARVGANGFRYGGTTQSVLFSIAYFLILTLVLLVLSYHYILRRFNHD